MIDKTWITLLQFLVLHTSDDSYIHTIIHAQTLYHLQQLSKATILHITQVLGSCSAISFKIQQLCMYIVFSKCVSSPGELTGYCRRGPIWLDITTRYRDVAVGNPFTCCLCGPKPLAIASPSGYCESWLLLQSDII